MIQLVGFKKNIDIQIREKLSINFKKQGLYREKLLEYFSEVVILSTCNRTEIYVNSLLSTEETLRRVFEVLNWDINLIGHCFCLEEYGAVKHLMEVICGFHSRILGEDQILGQIRDAYQEALGDKSVKRELQRLFQDAISCGKKFRTEGKLHEIPVSSASIVASNVVKKKIKDIMICGYGEVGKLVTKYILPHDFESLIIVVRDISKVDDIDDPRVKVMNFKKAKEEINNVGCIISCTSAPHTVIEEKDINKSGDAVVIFDLAVPRDVDANLSEFERVTLFDIDDISKMDDENKKLRDIRMTKNKYISDKYLKEFLDWKKLRDISETIREFKYIENEIVNDRVETFAHKCKNERDIQLAEMLIKSTSNTYVNRAIEVLKEETLKGSDSECIRMLEKIFLMKN